MKFFKIQHAAQPLVYIGIALFSLLLVVLFPEQVIASSKISYLFLLAALFINIRYGRLLPSPASTETTLNTKSWLCAIFLLQIITTIVFNGITQSINLIVPSAALEPIKLSNTTYDYGWGLLPWSLCLIIALGLLRVNTASSSTLFSPLLYPLASAHSKFGRAVEFYTKQGSLFALSISMAIFMLAISQIIIGPFQITIEYGLSFTTVIIASLLLFLLISRVVMHSIKFILQRYSRIGLVIASVTLATCILVVITNGIANYLKDLAAIPDLANFPAQLVNPPLTHKLGVILIGCWWLSWTPLIATYIAKLSRGRSIGAISSAVLCWPILLGIWHWVITNKQLVTQYADPFSAVTMQPWLIAAGFICLILVLIYSKTTHQLIYHLHTYHTQRQPRNPFKQTNAVVQSMISMLIIYMTLGINMVIVFAFVMIFPCLIIFIIFTIALLKDLHSRSSHEVQAK